MIRRTSYQKKIKRLFTSKPLLLCFLLVSCFMMSGCPDDEDNDPVKKIFSHDSRAEIWYKYLTASDYFNYHKYGLYANRLLTVKHPEVYLQGDSLFLENVDGRELQPIYDHEDTFFFYLDDIDFSHYEIIKNEDLYPVEIELFPYLDRRCLAAKSTVLKSRGGDMPKLQNRIKEIEKGVLYFCKIKKDDPEAAVYLLYSEDESCYVWYEGIIFNMYDDAIVSGGLVRSQNIILIFNDTFVWYPLMDRNDTHLDATLESLVSLYTRTRALPVLTFDEYYFLPYLKDLSRLGTEKEIQLAGLLAGKCNHSYGVLEHEAQWVPGMVDKWQAALPILKREDLVSMLGWYTYGSIDGMLTKQIIVESNVLSPHAYLLATYLPNPIQTVDLQVLTEKYFTSGFRWGICWELGFENYSLDEAWFCKGGACDIQGLNIVSVLNLKEVENYLYIGYRSVYGYAHTMVYLPDFGTTYSNAIYDDSGSIFLPGFPNSLFYLSHNEQWAGFIRESFYGNVEAHQTAEWLAFLRYQYDDRFYGLSRQDGDTVDVNLDEFITVLESDAYRDVSVLLTLP
ncbi:hypothetical protein ACFL27_00245 [candidate division CSSED10-310 bacterium]|uniref:Glycoside hydrolase 123 C-terminal domain-containing protein n=1 Tax=candidate division CSSED10-310 bacterium TaxID=2855610 RepID=A0ABV6YQX9_UNCC1